MVAGTEKGQFQYHGTHADAVFSCACEQHFHLLLTPNLPSATSIPPWYYHLKLPVPPAVLRDKRRPIRGRNLLVVQGHNQAIDLVLFRRLIPIGEEDRCEEQAGPLCLGSKGLHRVRLPDPGRDTLYCPPWCFITARGVYRESGRG